MFLLSPACRPDRVALLPLPNRTDASTNPLPCRPVSSRCPPFTSLSHEPASLTFPLLCYYYHQHRLIPHRYRYLTHIPSTLVLGSYSDATVAPPARDASKRSPSFPLRRPSSDSSPCTVDDAWCCRAAVYTCTPSLSFYRFPPLPPSASHPPSSHPTRHVPPLLLFSLSLSLNFSHWRPTCLSACSACLTAWLPTCLARLLTCLHASLPARLLACLLAWPACFVHPLCR